MTLTATRPLPAVVSVDVCHHDTRCTGEMLSDVIEMSFADAQPVTRMLFAEPPTYTRAPLPQPSYITNDGTTCMCVCALSVQTQHSVNAIRTAIRKAWFSRLRLVNVFG